MTIHMQDCYLFSCARKAFVVVKKEGKGAFVLLHYKFATKTEKKITLYIK